VSDIVNAIQGAIETSLSDVNTSIPGTIISYDPATNRAVVKPSLPKALADGRALDAPNIHEVAVAWPAGGGMLMTWPLKPGDGVELRFAQRSLEGWLSGNEQAPDDPRRFDMSDCIADPGLKATGISADPDAVQCTFDGTTVRLEPGGISRITGTKLYVTADIEHVGNTVHNGNVTQTGNLTQTGSTTATGNIVAGAVSLRQHTHLNSGGSGTGGPPVGG
jgi:hypothetical protein